MKNVFTPDIIFSIVMLGIMVHHNQTGDIGSLNILSGMLTVACLIVIVLYVLTITQLDRVMNRYVVSAPEVIPRIFAIHLSQYEFATWSWQLLIPVYIIYLWMRVDDPYTFVSVVPCILMPLTIIAYWVLVYKLRRWFYHFHKFISVVNRIHTHVS
jgi:lysylphosphatidylglycerol synthetase-like protein (DUF2156 family)